MMDFLTLSAHEPEMDLDQVTALFASSLPDSNAIWTGALPMSKKPSVVLSLIRRADCLKLSMR